MSAFVRTCCQTWPHIPCFGKPYTVDGNLSFTEFIDARPEIPQTGRVFNMSDLHAVSVLPMFAIIQTPFALT